MPVDDDNNQLEENKVMAPIKYKAISNVDALPKKVSEESKNSSGKKPIKKKNKDDSMIRKNQRSPSFNLGEPNKVIEQAK